MIHGGAQQYATRVPEARLSLRRLAPALSGTSDLLGELDRDQPGLVALLRGGQRAMSALTLHSGQLTDLVSSAGRTTAALADERVALGDSLARLPAVLDHSVGTFATARGVLDRLDPLVSATRPVTPQLAGFFARLDTVVRAGGAPLGRLAATVASPGGSNDLVDVLRALPALERQTRTAVPRAVGTLDASRPQVAALREYVPDLLATVARLAQVTANYDANGHYARVQPDLLAFTLDHSDNTLQASAAGNPLDALRKAVGGRCPGGQTQAQADGSAPVLVAGCAPTATPGGR